MRCCSTSFLKEHRTVQKQQKEIDALKGELKVTGERQQP
jgi:hypothetical protein